MCRDGDALYLDANQSDANVSGVRRVARSVSPDLSRFHAEIVPFGFAHYLDVLKVVRTKFNLAD